MAESGFADDLLRWYKNFAADLPWRRSRDPYLIWLSEIMLQQTQVTTVIPYFVRFTAAFPTVQALAAAQLSDVLKLWEGLGYYSRARNLHKAARQIVAQYGGQFPTDAATLQKLPGIGRYTAAAIASIAFGEGAAVLDGNVMRVLSRIDDLAEDIGQKSVQDKLWARAEALLSREQPGDYNQAMMELGRTLCMPRSPRCLLCPVNRHCLALAAGTQHKRPVRAARPKTPHYDVAAGVIWDNQGHLLIAQRPAKGLLGGLWEFPGGKQEAGESLSECLQRELREELAISVTVGELIVSVKHAFTHFKITLHAFECRYLEGPPQTLGCADWRWVVPNELDQFAFGRVDRHVIEVLRKRGGSG